MDRQGKIAVAIAIVILIGWQVYVAKTYKPPAPQPAAAQHAGSPLQTASASPAQSTSAPGPGQTVTATTAPVAEAEKTVPEKLEKVATPSVDYVFTNLGGGISKAILLKHMAEDDKHVAINEFGEIPIGAVSEQPGEEANAPYTVTVKDGIVTCERTTPYQIQITKKFTLPNIAKGKDQYVATLDLSFTNHSDQPYKNTGYYIYVGSSSPIHLKDWQNYIAFDWYRAGSVKDINAYSFGGSKIPFFSSPEKPSYSVSMDNIDWAGTYSQYFTGIITPLTGKGSGAWARRFPVDLASHEAGAKWLNRNPGATPPQWGVEGALQMPGIEVKPQATVSQQFRIYLGPRQYQLLKQLDEGESAILQFGWFGIVSKVLLSAMNHLRPFVGSYAAAIIVLTLVIKGALWPLQNRATQSMKKMQALSPRMNEIREKYKEDPARMNQETMKLYKDYGINPVAGCLPMFIQLPIFIGFYRMLGSAIELRNSTFFWVHDLSQPDTIFHIGTFPVNVLPLLMGATNIWMMAISPKSGDSAQQRMMILMPLIFIYICYSYASGLALYMMVSNLFAIGQLYLTRNQTAPVPQKVNVVKKKR